MAWDVNEEKFIRKRPTPSPKMDVKLSLLTESHKQFGIFCNRKVPDKKFTAVADTGCQTTTAGIDLLKALRIPKRFLIPTSHLIVGITDSHLDIMGALMMDIRYRGKTTKQMVYISSNSKGLYLSEDALKDLCLVSKEFPNQSSSFIGSATTAPKEDEIEENECDCECLPRSPPPGQPTKLPFPATEENKPKLKAWLIDHFSSSAFNTCTHQPLKEMTGPPMKIMFKENYTPYCVHKPIQVPHHWKYKVKSDLDQDVRLGIIEPVPPGTPTVWCARMVVTSKKNGKPRRTVDLQELKKATLRETH